MLDLIKAFRNAMLSAGMHPPMDIIADGEIHRFCNGKANSRVGWYVFNGYAGAYGDWRTGVKHRFHPNHDTSVKFDIDTLRTMSAKIMAQKQEALKEKRAKAKVKAKSVWEKASAVSVHPYLLNKDVPSFGLREHVRGELIVPGYNVLDELTTLQFIHARGSKKFLQGGQVVGSFYAIGMNHEVICITEGYATAATIHQCTGYMAIVAFGNSNINNIVKIFRLKYPAAKIIICGDDDCRTKGNPGLTKAHHAAIANHVYLSMPIFPNDRPERATDFNDMAKISGKESIKGVIDNARKF